VDEIKFRQQYNALLFVGVGASNDRNAVLSIARIVGMMGYIGGEVDKIARLSEEMLFQSLTHTPDSPLRI
jgi:hypothetical protein